MKKITLFLIISIITFQITNAQKLKGNKNVTTEHRDVIDFTSIIVKNNLNVILEESPNSKVSVESDENLQSSIRTRVMDGVLEVYLSQEISRKKALNVYIGVTDLIQRIEAQDNANISNKNEIHTGALEIFAKDNANIDLKSRSTDISIIAQDRSDIELSLSIEGNITITLEHNSSLEMKTTADRVNATITDSALFKPSGNCKEFVASAKSNANIKGKDLLTDYADIKASDRANVYVNVAKELIISTENMAKLYIYDNPKIFIDKFADKSTIYKK